MLLYNLAVLFLPFDITGYTQYTYILGNIELFTRAHGKQIEKRKQIIFLYLTPMYVYCVYHAI